MTPPPKRHVRVFRIRPEMWTYLITGAEEFLPFQGYARTYLSALGRGLAWLTIPAQRTPSEERS